MTGGIYKPGQGYWTRLMSAIALALVVLMGVNWIWGMLGTIHLGSLQPVYVQGGAAVLIVAVFGMVGYQLIGIRPRCVDFMIATEGEMKKVNWSTRREVLGSTWVVIALTIFIALFCWLCDLAFQLFFTWMDVLKAA